jgi:hypothetical protein
MNPNALPDAEQLDLIFEYDPDSGALRHKKTGKEAGYTNGKGYRVIRLNGRHHAVHRIIWKIVHRTEPPKELDHIDRSRSNNRIENLRGSNRVENCINRNRRSDNRSGFKGVGWCKSASKWRARIQVGPKSIYLGLYDTREAAAAAYMSACTEHYGAYEAVRPDQRHLLDAFFLSLAEADVRNGVRSIPGCVITETKKARL